MAPPASPPAPPLSRGTGASTQPQPRPRSPFNWIDALFKGISVASALSVVALFAVLIVILVIQSWMSITHFGASFLWTDAWDPGPPPRLGALSFIYGTIVTSAIGMALAVPFGVGTAAFLSEIATGWVRKIGAFLIELLAAIPSVVYGFWGKYFLAVGVEYVFGIRNGSGILSAGIILAIMIVPYITAISYDVCQAVPRTQREGALALGATRWQTIWTVILPYARPGIIGGCFLALGRALGETMAVVMLIGNTNDIQNPIFGKGSTIASVIANEMNGVTSDLKRAALVQLALILLLVTIIVNSLARVLIWRMNARKRSGFLGLPASWFSRPGQPATAHAPRPSPPPGGSPAPAPLPSNARAQATDRLMTGVLSVALVITCCPLFLILGYILVAGFGSIDLNFFIHDAVGNLPWERFGDGAPGLGNAIVGTGIMVLMASVIAVPIGILAAVYLVEYRQSPLASVVRFVGELLGGVPSIVLGIMGYALLVSPPSWLAPFLPFEGFSGWAGAFALAVMMIPIVMRSAEESMKLVPQSLRNASYALGAAYWQTVTRVTIPAALPAIVTGVFLAMARIAGETAPLLLTAFTNDRWSFWPGQQFPYLTYWIFYGSRDPDPQIQRLAWAAAVVLLLMVMFLNIAIRVVTGKRVVMAGSAD